MQEQAKDRGDTYCMQVNIEKEIFVSMHVNKLPVYLVQSAESMLPGPEEEHNILVYGTNLAVRAL